LRNRAREKGEDVRFVLQRYAGERFLHRLGRSAHRERFVLKGATLFGLWGSSLYRPTRDLDFTGYGPATKDAVLECFREVCGVAVEEDGLDFDARTLRAQEIREAANYDGIRVRFLAWLGNSRIEMQVDIGFGNAIHPGTVEVEYPTLLGGEAPRIRAYPMESVIAEKFEAMVVLGERNSRMKDFYDVFVLASTFEFELETLAGAVGATFRQRKTQLGARLPAALGGRFYEDGARARLWQAYRTKNDLPGVPLEFTQVGEMVGSLLTRVWERLTREDKQSSRWRAAGPWEESS
jgi:predicted nucleotidyltransferase component of viral defense system